MLFTDSFFLLYFLPAVLALFFLAAAVTPSRWREGPRRFTLPNTVLLVGSVVFLGWGTGPFMWWIAGAVAFNYLAALAIGRARRNGTSTSRPSPLPGALLTLAVTGNVVLLAVSKYALSLPSEFAARSFAVPQLLVPLGLTVFVCHAISYVVDVFRGHTAPQRSPIGASLYLLFFPLLCAGPLACYSDMGPQLAQRRVTMAAVAYGVRRWLVGFCKVVFLARALSVPVDQVFITPAAELGTVPAWLGAVCFTLQVYFDLSGYADMALGFGRMFGFRLSENFRWPYAAGTLTELWRRWNVTLFDWCRRYLGLSVDSVVGRGVGQTRQILLLFLCVGLWHGPGWNVLIWGGLHGVIVAIEQTGFGARISKLSLVVRHGYVLLVVLCLWVVFRAESLGGASVVLQAMAGLGARGQVVPLTLTPWFWTMLFAAVLSAFPLWPGFSRWLVTVDALTTSILILVSTSFVYIWRRCADMARLLSGRQ